MTIAARLDQRGPGSKRSSARRMLRLETVGARDAGGPHSVRIHNASSTGLLLESDNGLAVGDAIGIELPHAGVTTAHVVWASGTLYGCRFEEPVSDAVLAAAELRSDAGPGLAPPAMPGESFGSRLRRLRRAKRMTLAQLGECLAVSKPTVWAWENGKARPVEGRMAALAEALGVSEAELADVADEPVGGDILAHSREAIARAYGVEPGQVRIMIEL